MSDENRGLTTIQNWPKKLTSTELAKKPIERLGEDRQLHDRVKQHVLDRLKLSERMMSRFYARWTLAERQVQAYISLNDYEQILKDQNNQSKSPKVVPFIVPYCYASQATIATYHLHTFGGRRPIFQVGAQKAEAVEPAGKMEVMLQWNADSTRLLLRMWQLINDGLLYGLGVLRTQWKQEKKLRTVWRESAALPVLQMMGLGGKKKVREEKIVFEGTDTCSVDPFLFFPDPSVPMTEVSRRGEFVIWREYVGKHLLKRDEVNGVFHFVDRIPQLSQSDREIDGGSDGDSNRAILSGGASQPGYQSYTAAGVMKPIQVDQGTFNIIPAELGLGNSTKVEKWIITLGNKQQIIQCEPFDADHDMHPVVVSEPFGMGFGFGNPGLHDFIGPLQDTMSWFINSHTHNVRTAMNNMFVVDPSMVEMQDLKNPQPGKIIRLKRAAYGQDVRAALNQLQVSDVTRSHVNDLQVILRMGDALTGLNDNVRGLQDSGGRKTATEVRTSGEAAASRLAAMARVLSAQALVDLTEQQSLNFQQYLTEEFYLAVVGQEGRMVPLQISPEMVVGDFHYPVHDGTLPIDRVAMLDLWKEIWMAVENSPVLQQKYDGSEIFEHVAELGGARNLSSFIRQQGATPDTTVMGNEEVQQQAQAGNIVPVGPLPGTERNPASRLAQ